MVVSDMIELAEPNIKQVKIAHLFGCGIIVFLEKAICFYASEGTKKLTDPLRTRRATMCIHKACECQTG